MVLIKTIEKYPKLSIICLTCLLMLPNISGLWVNIMEARNFITAREMLHDGNWILTTLNGLPRYEKPPLPTFITAIFGWIFGLQNIFWLRLPTVIMVCITGIYTYLFSKQFRLKTQALVSGLIAVSSFYILMICHEAPWDIYAHAFMLIAIVHMLRAYHSENRWDVPISAVFIACSVLSKGPISIYVLLLPFLLAYGIVYGVKNKFALKTAVPLIIGILLGSIWFIYVRIADAQAFIEIVSTETANWTSYQMKPFYYYWTFFLQSGLWSIPAFIGLLYPYLRKRVSNKKAYNLSFLWTIFALILLSVIPEKKSRYLMPVLIPLAINTGFYIEYLIRTFPSLKHKYETVPVYINFGGLGILGLISPVVAYSVFPDKIADILPQFLLTSALLFALALILTLNVFRKNNMRSAFYLTLFFFAGFNVSAFPLLLKFQNMNKAFSPITNLKTEANKQHLQVYQLDTISPEMLWDYGSSIPVINTESGEYKFPETDKFYLLVNNKNNLFNSNATKIYNVVDKETFDRNIFPQNSKKHKPRNIVYAYIFTKKDTKD